MIWVHVHVCVVRVAKDSCMNGNPTLMNSLLVPCHLLTFTEIHPPPQVVKVRLPDLNIISSLDKTSIQGFLKGICRRRTFQMIKILHKVFHLNHSSLWSVLLGCDLLLPKWCLLSLYYCTNVLLLPVALHALCFCLYNFCLLLMLPSFMAFFSVNLGFQNISLTNTGTFSGANLSPFDEIHHFYLKVGNPPE